MSRLLKGDEELIVDSIEPARRSKGKHNNKKNNKVIQKHKEIKFKHNRIAPDSKKKNRNKIHNSPSRLYAKKLAERVHAWSESFRRHCWGLLSSGTRAVITLFTPSYYLVVPQLAEKIRLEE